jgi:hypothetical protein
MKRLLLLPILLLTGCALFTGGPTVHAPRAEFAVVYSDIKAEVAVWMFRVQQACAQQKLSEATCKELPGIEIGLKLLDEQAKQILRQADKDVDWAKIAQYVQIAISLAAKAAM